MIKDNGGRFCERVSREVHVVVSTEEMAGTFNNPYKLQFLPDFQADIEFAQMNSCVRNLPLLQNSIPIVGDNYLDDCISRRTALPVQQYLIPGFLVDTEKKFEVKRDAESSLDPVRFF